MGATLFSFRALEPRPRIRSIAWFRAHVQTHEGRPYDHGAYPHIGAPGGPCDALDDPDTYTIWLQWASRCGKSFFGQCASEFYAATQPCPMMFASSDQKLAVEVVKRTYAMLERCAPLKDQLRPPHRRKQDQVDFDSCRLYVAWSRSVSTLADKAIRFGHANEIDKWEHLSTSKEADPLKLFDDRFKEFRRYKRLKESTPSIKGRSRIERGRLQSTNCRMFVPCPHCGRYQSLSMERIKWDHGEEGRSNKDLARSTARYECEACDKAIYDEHRAHMMRRGVWVPEGCGVDDAKAAAAAERWNAAGPQELGLWQGWKGADWITGTPSRDSTDAGYQLSSLYALSLGWGDVAAEFVGSKEKPHELRNFINQWLADTWEIVDRQETWEVLGARIISGVPWGVVPRDCSVVTAGIDKQESHYVYVVKAWGMDRRSHTVSYGTCEEVSQLADMLSTPWRREGSNAPLHATMALIDSGYRPKGVAEFCRAYRGPCRLVPCKGANTPLNVPFRVSTQGRESAMPGMRLVLVDTMQSQDWIEELLTNPDTPLSIYSGSLFDHQDYLEQLLNDAPVTSLDTRNNSKVSWDRIDAETPNDYRDCERYAWIAMLIATRGGQLMQPPGALTQPAQQAPPRRNHPDPWSVNL